MEGKKCASIPWRSITTHRALAQDPERGGGMDQRGSQAIRLSLHGVIDP
ncbi:hypothetical protein HU200_033538 [Digitaria exilis]|uniref:Uncharacterized protein n=1 Tax=Digitaria exilis TaxID=1010633 RepID=A0A835BV31_9POAL|nr:hypothetical protein HU200_033538 [Digitaria exilis]